MTSYHIWRKDPRGDKYCHIHPFHDQFQTIYRLPESFPLPIFNQYLFLSTSAYSKSPGVQSSPTSNLLHQPPTTMSSFSKDWLTVAVLVVAFFGYFERTQPFYRQFKLSDSRLQHLFAHEERVTDLQLYFLCTVIPMGIVAGVYTAKRKLALLLKSVHATMVGLWISLTVAAVFTDILKDWIGNPRPDFLERCGAKPGTASDVYVDVAVCNAPLGLNRLADGMKLTPSGHSSMIFALMFYLYLWLGEHGAILRINRWIWQFLRVGPLLLGCYVAFSRTQDYRHHFFDVCLGLSIGIAVGWLLYKKYHAEIEV